MIFGKLKIIKRDMHIKKILSGFIQELYKREDKYDFTEEVFDRNTPEFFAAQDVSKPNLIDMLDMFSYWVCQAERENIPVEEYLNNMKEKYSISEDIIELMQNTLEYIKK